MLLLLVPVEIGGFTACTNWNALNGSGQGK
jgi:hypothetical protein